jgi:hypothetical protein
MFVYGNGKWHSVANVEERGQMKVYVAACGQHYPDESSVTLNKAVLDSKFFCGKCLALHRAEGGSDGSPTCDLPPTHDA